CHCTVTILDEATGRTRAGRRRFLGSSDTIPPMTADPRAFIPIDSDQALARAARLWAEAPLVGLDTEFIRTNTFFHRLGLIQVSDGRTSWLVDPLTARDLSPLVEVFRSPGIKILHSASEDMEVFYRALGVVPEP